MATSQTDLFAGPDRPDVLRIAPLGGCGEFGMNMTAYLYAKRLYVVDCGVRFPDPIRLGTDAIIPHVDPFFERAGGVHAYVITHGHEDHIGALPHILPRWPAPVYATAWTLALIRLKMARMGLDPERFSLIQVDPGDKVTNEDVSFEYVHVNHSIPMTCALYIRTPAANVFHTGDFKFDDHPIIEPPAAWSTLARVAEEGVDLLITDSTNAQATGSCPGEATVLAPLIEALEASPKAVVISTFASNLWRLKTVADACLATGRRLYVTGPGVEQTLSVASALGLYEVPATLRVSDQEIGRLPRERVVVLATGCQGEWRSALARIAAGEHRGFKIEADDTVILSSRIIPGNEKAIYSLMNDFLAAGARVVTAKEHAGLHVSGHAYGGDLERLIRTLKPQHYTPMHGGFSQLLANWQIGQGRLAKAEQSRIMENGDVLEVSKAGVTRLGQLEVEVRYVDSDARVVLPPEVLKERLKIGELGCALVTGAYGLSERRWLANPRVELLGLKLPDKAERDDFLETLQTAVRTRLPQLVASKGLSREDAFEELRISLRRQLAQVLQKKPVVLVKVHLV